MKYYMCVFLLAAMGWLSAADAPIAPPTAPLGWRPGVAAWSFNRFTLFEAIDRTAALGIPCLEAFESQRIRPDATNVLNATLPDADLARLKDRP
jgi:hypothetical protein